MIGGLGAFGLSIAEHALDQTPLTLFPIPRTNAKFVRELTEQMEVARQKKLHKRI